MTGTGSTNGSNLNSGSTTSAPAYSDTAGNGSWVGTGTLTYTPTDGSTPATTVSAGMWASVYTGTPTATPYIAQVASVGAGANGVITLSATNTFGTAPATSAVAKCIVGGPFADFGIVAGSCALHTGTVTQSTRINIQAAGTYSNTSTAVSLALAGTATMALWWRGYQTTPGDQDGNPLATAGTNIPSITFTTGTLTISGAHQMFSSLDMSGAPSAALVTNNGSATTFYRFRCTNSSANASAYCLNSYSGSANIAASYFKLTGTGQQCMYLGGNSTSILGSYISGGSSGISLVSTAVLVAYCVFDSVHGDAITSIANSVYVVGCSFYNPTGNGINFTTGPANLTTIANCYFEGVTSASKYAINNSTGTNTDLIHCIANAYYNCTGTVNGVGDFPLIFDNGILSGSAFNAPASQNFTINSLGYALGFPGTLEKVSASDVGYRDVGALQHQGAAGLSGQIMRVAGQHFPVW